MARSRQAGLPLERMSRRCCCQAVHCLVFCVCRKPLHTPAEVKNQELFGLHSGHYLGGSGKGKGLAEQVAQMLAVAAAPEHKRRGRSPQVVVYFPSGVDDEVAAALTALGAKVANGTGSLAAVCGIVGNNVTNLDVTTLCALVSEVSWRDPYCDELQAWGARTVHWKVCGGLRHGWCWEVELVPPPGCWW